MGSYRDDMPFTIDQVVRLLGLEIKREKPTEWLVNCPFCLGKSGQPDRHGHLSVYLRSDTWCCHRCGRKGGKLQLYMACRPTVLDTRQAYREILEELEGPRKSGLSRPVPQPIELPPSIESDKRASSEELHDTYTKLIGMLTLASAHRQNLRGRGLPDEEIDRLQYRSVPAVGQRKLAAKLLEAGCILEGVPGFYLDEEDRWTLFTWRPGIIMPERDVKGRIHGLQVRKDNVEKRKCYWITGTEKKLGVPHPCIIHFSNPSLAAQNGVIYFTEGIMKADIASYFSNRGFISVPGTSHFSKLKQAAPIMKKIGVKKVVMAFDMDMYENAFVMDDFQFAREILFAEGFEVCQISWDRNYKGIDDYLKSKIVG